MPRSATISVENNFTKGLITEFTAMNFPENAVTEGDNVVFSELGAATRRLGMDYEDDFEVHNLSLITASPNCYTEFEWSSVGNNGTTTFVVQQIGNTIIFFESGELSVSDNRKNFAVNLNSFRTAGTTVSEVASNPCQYTSGKGYLFVVHPFCQPFYVAYDADTDSITSTPITLEVRDFEGLDDNLENDVRPATLSVEHHYNLFNQGWYTSASVFQTGGGNAIQNVMTAFRSYQGRYPSNADIWWVFKGSTEWAYFGSEVSDFTISKGLVGPTQITLGNTPAPRGHYIYDAFDIDRTAKTGIVGLARENAGRARPSCIAFYAGRTFYAGTAQDGFSDRIYFSQIIESDTQLGRCYQINDPTSETIFDLLDTDGGVILLPTIERVVSLKVLNDALIIIGTNGVFTIRGTENGPFRATDYTVDFVGATGGVSNLSVAEVDGSLLWWNNDGIYGLSKDQIGVYYQIQNVSKETIQSILDIVPPENKTFVKGQYNRREKKVQWVYSDILDSDPYTYNRILEFNTTSKAFYTHTIDTSLTPRVVGIISISGVRTIDFFENVFDNLGQIVTDNNGDPVEIVIETFAPNIEVVKFPTRSDIGGIPIFTYSELHNENHLDWEAAVSPGASYLSYFISGYRIRGEFLRTFNSTPIMVLMENFEDGQLLMSGIWDYGFRETTTQQLYLTRPEVDYIIRRVKLRGKGRSLQLKFQSSGNAPFSLSGWSSLDSGGQQP